MNIESQTVKVTSVTAIVTTVLLLVFGAYSWAEDKHAKILEETKTQKEQLAEYKTQTELLKQLVKAQTEALEKTTEEAKKSADALIRIETKLDQL